ncbi:fluoride efflux transporter CrcB [Pseudomonas citronellolis]|uniref:fluoride efflux transporter CrcB n=1 Tax=Pseudomonas citronellolis TaxID=53408 RepID=UPI0007189BBB|nr:fluoride efflux transporter CrcB [Pseudomonas citronellolis]KRV80942.1 camphor resistance protein CrcB [Pseudomonas citronellolis]KRW77958.1 camphor resistance protein CrcB [Pseudomonas citronellolis]
MWKPVLAIALGAAIGALLRWYLGLKLNSLMPNVPPGTLAANLIGGYIIGVAVAYFASAQGIAPEWRLLIITGFCGGLTTFSTFSAEVVTLLQEGRLAWAMGAVAVHVGGSLAMTLLGLFSGNWLMGR